MLKWVVFAVLSMSMVGDARWVGGDNRLWKDFKATYNRRYNNATEELLRYKCFVNNLDHIEQLNAHEPDGAVHAVNAFSDLCHEEFQNLYHGAKVSEGKKNYSDLFHTQVVEKALGIEVKDWREKGAVTEVKDQGQCRSGWAFAATGNMEALNFLRTGTLVSLSEEELVECSRPDGCLGGTMEQAFYWVSKNGGITTEEDYPYTSSQGSSAECRKDKLSHAAVQVYGFLHVPEDEDMLMAYVEVQGPVSVLVDATQGWQLYSSGIKKSCDTTKVDHGALIVGYGQTPAGVKYWIVKNSWGASWGEGGYIRLLRDVNCNGIAKHAVIAV